MKKEYWKYFKCILHPNLDRGPSNMRESKEFTRQDASDAAFRITKLHREKIIIK